MRLDRYSTTANCMNGPPSASERDRESARRRPGQRGEMFVATASETSGPPPIDSTQS
jgi:hypothetical protein